MALRNFTPRRVLIAVMLPSAVAAMTDETTAVGYVSLIGLRTPRGKLGLSIERDLHFEADEPITGRANAFASGRAVRISISAPGDGVVLQVGSSLSRVTPSSDCAVAPPASRYRRLLFYFARAILMGWGPRVRSMNSSVRSGLSSC